MKGDPHSRSLEELAAMLGVATSYRDTLDQDRIAPAETVVRTCAALGAPIERIDDAADAVRQVREERSRQVVEPVAVAWNGIAEVEIAGNPLDAIRGELELEDGARRPAVTAPAGIRVAEPLPPGYHRLHVEIGEQAETVGIISAPMKSWHPDEPKRGWGVAAHLAALRSATSRSVGDLGDLTELGRWIGDHGGGLIGLLPLLPTFNDEPTEPSPYSPVSRMFWSELMLDIGPAGQPVSDPAALSVERADAEVRAALAASDPPPDQLIDEELARYARFRGAQRRLGRDWRTWPQPQRDGQLSDRDVDAAEEEFHLKAQAQIRHQLAKLSIDMGRSGVGLGLDLAVGVHSAGYDTWSRSGLFAPDASVGAPPDKAFPSGQSWGFPPVLPHASRLEHHAYHRACVAHQAAVADVLRIDHVMAMHRLYWIPDGMDLSQGTYVHYPADELFAVLCLESHRHRCEIVGENLGMVPAETNEALPRHRIWGMFLAEFEATAERPIADSPPDAMAMIGTHDTPTFAGWLDATDVRERIRLGLLDRTAAAAERDERVAGQKALAETLNIDVDDPDEFLAAVLEWLGGSDSPLVVVWLEDMWLEDRPVNVPGSSAAERPNWQRPMRLTLEQIFDDEAVNRRIDRLAAARRSVSPRRRTRGS